ncbi:hypothetical protein V6N13_047400 [Hibiscus sabdariffa]
MSACVRYLQNGGALPRPCCDGVQALNGMARTTPDRQTACRCLQNAAKTIPDIKPNLAETLPGKCGVNIPYRISTSTYCNRPGDIVNDTMNMNMDRTADKTEIRVDERGKEPRTGGPIAKAQTG